MKTFPRLVVYFPNMSYVTATIFLLNVLLKLKVRLLTNARIAVLTTHLIIEYVLRNLLLKKMQIPSLKLKINLKKKSLNLNHNFVKTLNDFN